MASSGMQVRKAVRSRPRLDGRLGLIVERLAAQWDQVLLVSGSVVIFLASILFPYWNIVLRAPQYPRGLSIDVYVYKLEDMRSVREVDGLNHYIGMIKLTDAATIERAISIYAMVLFGILAVASLIVGGRWRWLLRLPIILFPVAFVVDLFAWLYYAGNNLDPTAALSSSIRPFTPRILGTGTIGQFSTEAAFEVGFWMAVLAAVIMIVALWRLRRPKEA